VPGLLRVGATGAPPNGTAAGNQPRRADWAPSSTGTRPQLEGQLRRGSRVCGGGCSDDVLRAWAAQTWGWACAAGVGVCRRLGSALRHQSRYPPRRRQGLARENVGDHLLPARL